MTKLGEKMNAVLTMGSINSPFEVDHQKQFDRDRRTMNHMDDETKAVHLRLEAWGAWAKDHVLRAWPSTTPMGRIVDEGIHGAGQGSRPPISMPTHIEQVDVAVAKLGQIDSLVIKRYYLYWEPREVMARRANMRVKKFDNVLKRARWRISGFLAAQNI